MKTKLIALVSIVCFFINISISFAGSWIKNSSTDASRNNCRSEITNDKTPESSNEGLYAKYWADGNDIGLSLAGWLLREKKNSPFIKEINGSLSDASIKHEYQWMDRNVPRMAFSCDWTEALYIQNKGNCDNSNLFNNEGLAKAYIRSVFNLGGGPQHTLDNYRMSMTISAENKETNVKISPEVQLSGKLKEYNLIESSWDDVSDNKKSWQASGGDIVSYSIGMDNMTSDNILIWGYIGSTINVKIRDSAKNALAGIFQELSGFDLKMDGVISDTETYLRQPHTIEDFEAYGQISHVWHKAVGKLGLSLKYSSKVIDFLRQIHLRDNSQSLNENQVAESIIRYFEQFSYTFEGETKDQASYYMAWLLAEAAARPVNTSENITNTRVSFEYLIDKLTNILKQNAKQAIGNADSPEMQEEISENLARVKGRLLYYYYKLSVDPLFPAFKKPIDNDIEEIILKKFEDEKILFNLLNNQIKTEPENEFNKKWLSFYFDRVAERVVFWLVIETNKDEFRNPKYWGGLHYRARSIRNGLWPVEIYLAPIKDE